jgi:hypothetical protein
MQIARKIAAWPSASHIPNQQDKIGNALTGSDAEPLSENTHSTGWPVWLLKLIVDKPAHQAGFPKGSTTKQAYLFVDCHISVISAITSYTLIFEAYMLKNSK